MSLLQRKLSKLLKANTWNKNEKIFVTIHVIGRADCYWYFYHIASRTIFNVSYRHCMRETCDLLVELHQVTKVSVLICNQINLHKSCMSHSSRFIQNSCIFLIVAVSFWLFNTKLLTKQLCGEQIHFICHIWKFFFSFFINCGWIETIFFFLFIYHPWTSIIHWNYVEIILKKFTFIQGVVLKEILSSFYNWNVYFKSLLNFSFLINSLFWILFLILFVSSRILSLFLIFPNTYPP